MSKGHTVHILLLDFTKNLEEIDKILILGCLELLGKYIVNTQELRYNNQNGFFS